MAIENLKADTSTQGAHAFVAYNSGQSDSTQT